MRNIIAKLIISTLISFFSMITNAQELCNFVQKVQDYQNSVRIKYNGKYDVIDSTTFNIKKYLGYFDKLSTSQEIKIDVYYIDNFFDGNPYLYALKKSQNFDLIIDSLTSKRVLIDNRKVKLKKNGAIYWFLNEDKTKASNNLIPEDSKIGFLQYLFFSIMGEQFALKWHANYNQKYIICNKEQLDDLRAKFNKRKVNSDTTKNGQEVEIESEPFTVNKDSLNKLIKYPVQIKVEEIQDYYTFTWLENRTHSGIYECTYKIASNFPYKIEKIAEKELLRIIINFLY